MNKIIEQIWYGNSKICYLLAPLSGLYRLIVATRRSLYRFGLKKSKSFSVPVIIVGNLTVGGTGKTPLVIWLANWLRKQGFHPGLVSRGYGGKPQSAPKVVTYQSAPYEVGDEPALLVRKTNCPLIIYSNRAIATEMLLQHFDCDIVISDDGLQHYALSRDIEIMVIDGMRRFGNAFCLPAGPLRESQKRSLFVDFQIVNQPSSLVNEDNAYSMKLMPQLFYCITDEKRQADNNLFKGQLIHAVAGIGNPSRFFQLLRQMGLMIREHAFPDHYNFQPQDIDFGDNAIVVMTEKDAIKCQSFADHRHWCLPVEVTMEERFCEAFRDKLKAIIPKHAVPLSLENS